MSWDKRALPGDVVHYPGRQEVEYYLYTPGKHGERIAEILKKGKVPALRCPDGTLILPPKTFCPETLEEGEVVEAEGPFILALYTIVYEDGYGRRLEEPVVIGFITMPGARGGLLGRVKAPLDALQPGIPVKPVFREEREGSLYDILYWEPA